ncbi:MAG: Maf family nucleotide pyrophosphatase [Prevotella sp.]
MNSMKHPLELGRRRLLLASASPRRRQLLAALNVDFDVRVLPDIDETFPETLPVAEAAEYISNKKASAYQPLLSDDDILITADTTVVLGNTVLGKPVDKDDARRMLRLLSGCVHQVITGVTIATTQGRRSFSVTTDVTFKTLADSEIDYYVETYSPLDKAGAYGIQEWIGHIGVTAIKGSYFNVVGLPVQRIYEELRNMN